MDLEATPEERSQLEYATQHFGFTPDSFVETISTSAVEKLTEDLEVLRKHVAQNFSGKISKQALEESFALIRIKYVASAQNILDNFSTYIKRNILIVPKDVVLPEDRVHLHKHLDKRSTEDEKKESNKECNLSEQKNGESIKKNSCEGKSQDDTKFYNGDNLVESLKGFDRQCQNVRNAKYKEAVLKAKLANLEAVANKQAQLLKEVEDLAENRHRLDSILESQVPYLDRKIDTLKELMRNNQDLFQDGGDVHHSITGNGADEAREEGIARNRAEKRSLATALEEDAVMAKTFRVMDAGENIGAIERDNTDTDIG